MRRLRLRPEVEEYVAGWSATASREDRERLAQVLESFADGSWLRWFPDEEMPGYIPDPEWTKFWPGKGLIVMMQATEDEASGEGVVDRLHIYRMVEPAEDDVGLPLFPE